MTDDATQFSGRWPASGRKDPACLGDERTMLVSYLDYYRATFEAKCAGLAGEQASRRSVPPSTLSLHGLVRHLAGCERWWFRLQFAGETLPDLFDADDPDADFEDLSGDFRVALDTWRAECDAARQIVERAASMDETGTRLSTGEPFALRWVMLRMIAEYARHDGHADLLRESIDGATGE
jgi:Protein of unknown function (DUF664)